MGTRLARCRVRYVPCRLHGLQRRAVLAVLVALGWLGVAATGCSSSTHEGDRAGQGRGGDASAAGPFAGLAGGGVPALPDAGSYGEGDLGAPPTGGDTGVRGRDPAEDVGAADGGADAVFGAPDGGDAAPVDASEPPLAVPPGAACALAGAVGLEVDCPLRVARVADDAPPAAALQAVVDYDTSVLRLVGIFADVCYEGAGCFEQTVFGDGPGQPLRTGHTLTAAPSAVEDWADPDANRAILLVNIADPHVPLSDAWLDASGKVHGDPEILRFRFELLGDVSPTAPATLMLDDVLTTSGDSLSLQTDVEEGLVISGYPSGP